MRTSIDYHLMTSNSTYVSLIHSLVLEWWFEDVIEVVFDMLGNSMGPDFLTYKTLLEGLCREGRGSETFELLDELRKRDFSMSGKITRLCSLDRIFLVESRFNISVF